MPCLKFLWGHPKGLLPLSRLLPPIVSLSPPHEIARLIASSKEVLTRIIFQTKRHSALTRFIKYSGIIIVYHELRIVRLHYILKCFLIVGCPQIINSVCDCYGSFNSSG